MVPDLEVWSELRVSMGGVLWKRGKIKKRQRVIGNRPD
jgi:hypothetical protein